MIAKARNFLPRHKPTDKYSACARFELGKDARLTVSVPLKYMFFAAFIPLLDDTESGQNRLSFGQGNVSIRKERKIEMWCECYG